MTLSRKRHLTCDRCGVSADATCGLADMFGREEARRAGVEGWVPSPMGRGYYLHLCPGCANDIDRKMQADQAPNASVYLPKRPWDMMEYKHRNDEPADLRHDGTDEIVTLDYRAGGPEYRLALIDYIRRAATALAENAERYVPDRVYATDHPQTWTLVIGTDEPSYVDVDIYCCNTGA